MMCVSNRVLKCTKVALFIHLSSDNIMLGHGSIKCVSRACTDIEIAVPYAARQTYVKHQTQNV